MNQAELIRLLAKDLVVARYGFNVLDMVPALWWQAVGHMERAIKAMHPDVLVENLKSYK